jgi:hypothetical protein
MIGLSTAGPSPSRASSPPWLIDWFVSGTICVGLVFVPIILLVVLAAVARRRRLDSRFRRYHLHLPLPPDEPAPDLRLPDRSPEIQRDQERS